MSTLTYISSTHGDWCGIYINGKLQEEGRSIEAWYGYYLLKLGTIIETRQLEICGEWLERSGTFPTEFSDIPIEKLT